MVGVKAKPKRGRGRQKAGGRVSKNKFAALAYLTPRIDGIDANAGGIANMLKLPSNIEEAEQNVEVNTEEEARQSTIYTYLVLMRLKVCPHIIRYREEGGCVEAPS